MRRRAIALALLCIGALLLGAALAVRLFLVPTMVRLPLDQTGSTTVADANGSFFDVEVQEQQQGYVEANVVVQGDPEAEEATEDVAVWVSGTTITDEDGELVTPPTELVFCIDRHTAESVPCESAAMNKEAVEVEGLTVTFPFDTERRDYEVWNSNAGAAFTAEYAGEEELEGLTVYRFEQSIPEQVIDQREVPSAFAGGTGSGNVTADVVFSNERTIFVEPTSGMIVKVTENPVTALRGPDGAEGVTILSAALAPEDVTVRDGIVTVSEKVADATETRDQITLLRSTVPWLLAGLGLVLLVAGLVLQLTGRRGAHSGAPAEAPQHAEPVHS
jgi:Porin PorA